MACMRELFITLNVNVMVKRRTPCRHGMESVCVEAWEESLDVMTIAVSTPIVCDAFS